MGLKQYLDVDQIEKDHETYLYPDGKIFKGSLQAGLPSGEGYMIFTDGKILSGKWKDGQFLNWGVMTWQSEKTNIQKSIIFHRLPELDLRNYVWIYSEEQWIQLKKH